MTDLFTRTGTAQAANGQTVAGKPLHIHGTSCGRCGGEGGRREWAHTGWTCFQCGGSGKGPTVYDKLYTAEELAKLNATAAKKAANKVAKVARETAKRNAEIEAAVAEREAYDAGAFAFCEGEPRWMVPRRPADPADRERWLSGWDEAADEFAGPQNDKRPAHHSR